MNKLLTLLLMAASFSAFASTDSKKASELAEAAWNYYYFNESAKAETALKKALEFDSKNSELRMAYAKTLFRNKKYKNVVSFVTDDGQKSSLNEEESFLVAVSHYNNYQTDSARPYFQSVSDGKGELSVAAKSYLEKLDNRKRMSASANFGLVYDSSIIDEDFLSNNDGSDGRIFIGGDFKYQLKPVANFQTKLTAAVANFYSFDDNLSIADPLLVAVGGEMVGQKSVFGADHDLFLRPGVDILWLDATNDGSREVFMISPGVSVEATRTGQSGSVATMYGQASLSMGQVDSLEDTTSDVDGLVLKAGQRNVTSMDGNKTTVLDVYGKFNFASGDNIRNFRVGGNYSYLMPYRNWNVGLVGSGKYSYYPKAGSSSSARTDVEVSAMAVASRSVKELLGDSAGAWLDSDWLTLDLKTGYTQTFSSEDVRDNGRFVVSSIARGNWSF